MRRSNHELRLIFYRRQNGCCWLCGEALDLFQPTHTVGSPSWEHVIPASSGGSDRLSNLALTHHECNKLRGDRFIFRIERPVQWPPKHRWHHKQYQQVGFEIALRKLKRILSAVPRRGGR